MTDLTPALLAGRLAARAEDVARWLLPNGQQIGDDWCVGSIKGEPGKSCKIRTRGKDPGRWADFAEADSSDWKDRGDLLDLIALSQEIDLGKAMKKACDFLGIEKPVWADRKRKQYAEPEQPKNARSLSKSPSVLTWVLARKISAETYARYRVFADGDGTVVYPYMRDGKVLHLKYRSIAQKRFWSSADTERGLFGWQALEPGARAVCITEGEQDCIALAEYGLQALSIPVGAGKGDKQDWIETEWEQLERFDTIYINMDMDGPGMKSVQELADRLGRHRCKLIKLPHKDANECLMQGTPKTEILKAVREAKSIDPQELRNAADFTDAVIERFYPASSDSRGFYFPWHSIEQSFVAGWGETTIIAGYSGHGKSEVVGQIMLDAMRQKQTCCIASLEFRSSKWLRRCVRQATHQELPERGLIRKTMDWFGEYMWAFDVYGSAKADRIMEVFEYAHRRYGARVFAIDNFSKLGIADDDLAEQKRVINLITEFSVRLNVHVILVHHLRKEETDYSANNMSKLSLKGSGSLGDLVDNIALMWRNRSKEKALKDPRLSEKSPEDQQKVRGSPDSVFAFEKIREGDDEPRLALYFHRASHQWTEQPGGVPYRYSKEDV